MSLPKGLRDNFLYLRNDDNSYEVLMAEVGKYDCKTTLKAMQEYEWNEEDFLLTTFPKNGTHLCWEIMQMLLNGKSNYVEVSKVVSMMDIYPITLSQDSLPSPQTVNTHYRLDVLPKQFRNRKTVLVIRNPKDTVVSFYFHAQQMHANRIAKLGRDVPFPSFDEYIDIFLRDHKDDYVEYGNYFTYLNYMWNLTKNENSLVLFFEDLKKSPLECVKRLDKFMGTKQQDKLIKEIADATDFDKMKEGKRQSVVHVGELLWSQTDLEELGKQGARKPVSLYRKGKIGDWKNHFSVATNEKFDNYLKQWPLSSEIPFIYE